MKLNWSPEAVSDLASLRDHIAQDNPDAAERVALVIIETVEGHLLDNPELGAPGRVAGTRELIIPKTPFTIPYRIRTNVLEVLGVYHHARRWPDRL